MHIEYSIKEMVKGVEEVPGGGGIQDFKCWDWSNGGKDQDPQNP